MESIGYNSVLTAWWSAEKL